jgi:hypothetical protein
MREKGKGKRKYVPNKMKEDIVKSILESIEVGMSITDACELAGVNRGSFYVWKNKEGEASKLLRGAELKAKKRNIGLVNKAAVERDWRAAAWWLERKYPEEYSLKDRRVEKGTGEEKIDELVEAIEKGAVRTKEDDK